MRYTTRWGFWGDSDVTFLKKEVVKMKKIAVTALMLVAMGGLLHAQQMTLLYNFDFNTSDQGWTSTTAPGDPNHCDNGINDWQWGPADCYVPEFACDSVPVTNIWGTVLGGCYSNHSESRLYSPPITLPVGECDQFLMEVCHYYATENNYDGGNVVILPPNDPTGPPLANPLPVFSGWDYDGTINTSATYFACLVDNENGFMETSGGFVKSFFNLTGFQEQPFIIGFDFGSDDYVTNPGWYIKWVKIWCVGPTDVEEGSLNEPQKFFLSEPVPNPAGDKAELSFSVPSSKRVDLSIYDATGRKIATLVNGTVEAGKHSVTWNIGSSVKRGIYFARLQAGDHIAVQKIEVLR